MKKKILLVFGTRPEAIKMIPVFKAINAQPNHFEVKICLTAQHREMLDQVLTFFNVKADFDLNLMQPGQDLYNLSSRILLGMKKILELFNPDVVLVHGDTTTTSMVSLASFYHKTKVGHVEAGLRTHNIYSPFPEELNRQITGRIANYHFAPTESSKNNLLKENIPQNDIIVTGNTVIDALIEGIDIINNDHYQSEEIESINHLFNQPSVLITGHRRENFGKGFINICNAIKELSSKNKTYNFIYPVHLNPNVLKPVNEILGNIDNVHLISPLSYPSFIYAMNKSEIILTDSGGVQEEAPSLGKPVLVMRNNTERPEAVDAGTVKLVGTDTERIVSELSKLISDKDYYNSMALQQNPYGDGKASERIVEFLKNNINE